MMEKITRNYLEIKSIKELSGISKPGEDYKIEKVSRNDFQLNKFLYKQIGKKYNWVDRLAWTDRQWRHYVSNEEVFTYVLKKKDDLAGFFELIFHRNKSEVEMAYFGLLEEYMGKKLGGYMLSDAIKKSFSLNANRIWVHTCSLDHKNALENYLSRGMKIFNTEVMNVKTA